MIIAGIGEAGKNIAKLFKPHTKNYKILIFDENDGIEPRETVEEYDEHPIKIKARGLKSHAEGILFVCGSGKVAGATMRVLEALEAHQMTVVYIIPDLEFASSEERLRHKVHFNVLQQFARSGRLKEMIILDNKALLELAGAGPIRNYYEKVNFFIYSTFQNLNYCSNVAQEFGSLHQPKEHSRISTISMAKLEDAEEKFLFSLDNITESCYYMNIEEEDLNSDDDVLGMCKQIVRENKSKDRESSFAIWLASDPSNYYVKHYTHYIQEIS
jgi:hypothetical protein